MPEDIDTAPTRRILPSTPAAIVAGAVVMPLFVCGLKFIEAAKLHPLAVFLWFVVAFFLPVLLATADLKYAARRRRELGSIFRPAASPDDFRLFYFPTWGRMFIGFVSAAASMALLKALGVEL